MNVPQKIKIDLGFPGGSDGKASACNAGDPGSIPGLGRSPRRRKWQSTPPLLPGKSHGRRRLIGYSPWGRKESDTTERLYLLYCVHLAAFDQHCPYGIHPYCNVEQLFVHSH